MDGEHDSEIVDDLITNAQNRCYYFGMKPAEFWSLTPYETTQWFKAQAERNNDLYKLEWNQTVFASWHTAAFQRSKHMPKYETMLKMIGIEVAKKQSPKEMLQIAEQLTLAMGGKPREEMEVK